MNQRFAIGLTAILLTTSLPLTKTVAQENPVAKSDRLQQTIKKEQNSIATVYSYQWGDEIASTLYVRGIPVLTFVSSADISINERTFREIAPRKESQQNNNDPIARARTVASSLNQLYGQDFDASKINVSWNEETKTYIIKIDEEKLVEVDRKTISAKGSQNLATDALRATNKLRSLLGNAPPLTSIVGQPEMRSSSPSIAYQKPIRSRGQMRGKASWYGGSFHGRPTANGEKYNQYALTAAHRTLPFGTRVRVTNLNNGRSVIVRINDRGPFIRGRIIDLSRAAASQIGMLGSGIAPVRVEVLER
ncbi:MAG: septal ring lytic transglycosylase RlpA family protein [Prochloraceae cyanobacterium]|nr:septal ring lytic transglycosylase RlpA family protein [Prochloraceae cyanobacterium]